MKAKIEEGHQSTKKQIEVKKSEIEAIKGECTVQSYLDVKHQYLLKVSVVSVSTRPMFQDKRSKRLLPMFKIMPSYDRWLALDVTRSNGCVKITVM